MPSSATAFRLFGFPVHVRSGFWMFMTIIVFINAPQIGLGASAFFAAMIAVFTLVHELGHALAARATGAQAEISLAFMVGYASFMPTRHLSRWERAGISFAGPAIQIVTGLALYLALGGPLEWPIHNLTHAQFAALWAGPGIGVFNLIPVLPFDGGNILEQAVSLVAPDRARRIMMWFTVVAGAGALVYLALTPRLQPLIIFVILPLLSVGQMFASSRARAHHDNGQESLARAEALAWGTGDVTRFPAGRVPSPWFRAYQQLQQGHPDVARDLLLADLASTDPVNYWPPDGAPLRVLESLVALLPRPLPQGRSFSSFVLSGVLLRLGEYEEAGHYAAAAYNNGRASMLAVHVARAAAALGDRTTAFAWLRTAATTAPADAFQIAVDTAPEFDILRDEPEFANVFAR